ncbi:ATP-dependent RecD-like DNA helicase [Candidatus Dependentiae bacterium]|nr:ATP-dependent RecD-like DNA helicase [Candidatus Dependentiae bacterium]
MQELETLSGTVDRFLFQNTENGYSVFIVQALSSRATITVTGCVPHLHSGQEVQLKGNWIFHPKFGKQFEAKYCVTQLPTTLVGLKKYLSSGLIKGIGKVYADKLVNHFGADIIAIIEKNPQRLQEVEGMGAKRVELLTATWHEQKDIANLMIFLQEKDISPSLAARIYKKYKHEAVALLHENPYRLADDIWGIGFKTADEVAQKLGFNTHAPQRIAAGIVYVITMASQSGHLYVELEDLKTKTIALLALEHNALELIKNGLHTLYNNKKIKLLSHEEKHFITLAHFYASEQGVAQRILGLIERPANTTINTARVYNHLRAPAADSIALNEDQQRAILSCLTNKITVITGGPGTGKTTVIKTLLQILELERINYKLAAPTGRAAKRIIESTGKIALTIHRLLEFDVGTMSFSHNENKALKLDFLIIDEASMLDIFLAHAVLKALPYTAHLVLIGDVDQLPSVGPGNVLNDILRSEKVSYVRLTQIFRQAQNSLIITNAHRINNGEMPVSFQEDSKRDFVFLKEENPESMTDILKRLLFIELPKKGISPEDAMILSPMNRGIVGTFNLNHILQGMLNPHATHEQINHAGTLFKHKDKVMQIRNNYDKHVYNGDIGVIEEINLEDKLLTVNFGDNRVVLYEFDELNELVLAYAISIHKSQGSEYRAIIVPLFMQHFMLLQRNLVYTALTRARNLCVFVGQPKALAMAIRNTKGSERITFLKKFLIEPEDSSTAPAA